MVFGEFVWFFEFESSLLLNVDVGVFDRVGDVKDRVEFCVVDGDFLRVDLDNGVVFVVEVFDFEVVFGLCNEFVVGLVLFCCCCEFGVGELG